jgi:hypothetical protein
MHSVKHIQICLSSYLCSTTLAPVKGVTWGGGICGSMAAKESAVNRPESVVRIRRVAKELLAEFISNQ